MFDKALPGDLARHLETLGQQPWMNSFYLAGGTACTLQLGHRISRDLDFFTKESFAFPELTERLSVLGRVSTETHTGDTFNGTIDGTRISFFRHPYPLIAEPVLWRGVTIVNLRDIGCMKLNAIQGRGVKRDFIDLWAILKSGFTLEELFDLFGRKYAGADYSKAHLVKSLTYFVDAEADPMPEMLIPVSWAEIEEYIGSEVRAFTERLIGTDESLGA